MTFAMWNAHRQAVFEMEALRMAYEEWAWEQAERERPPTREMLIDAGYGDWQP